jgi:hypothetical protein
MHQHYTTQHNAEANQHNAKQDVMSFLSLCAPMEAASR